ncbi:MAG: T9SS type A sorting domain-containing protein, partial [Brumimicrobium sp.]
TGGSPATGVGSISSTTYNSTGTYNIELTIENSCGGTDSFSRDIVVIPGINCGVGLNEEEKENWTVFYAATDELIKIENLTNYNGDAYVTNVSGQIVVDETSVENGWNTIDAKHLNRGVYFVVINSNGTSQLHKFVK